MFTSGKYEKVDPTVGVNATVPAEGSSGGKEVTDASGVKETLSPAMDILMSSNFESLLWYLAFENAVGLNEEEKRREASARTGGWRR
jgi:threonine synthase